MYLSVDPSSRNQSKSRIRNGYMGSAARFATDLCCSVKYGFQSNKKAQQQQQNRGDDCYLGKGSGPVCFGAGFFISSFVWVPPPALGGPTREENPVGSPPSIRFLIKNADSLFSSQDSILSVCCTKEFFFKGKEMGKKWLSAVKKFFNSESRENHTTEKSEKKLCKSKDSKKNSLDPAED
ncbi:uncharacterized protein LOC110024139 [Phalaenopsis equestris]|uniref:uncharacterized protein LOC110024139 n=1 Tax=Phalaenopsis equestris TaxID=78828 RepID=UPI0009E5EF78|nr:uncharacterized protein LOC110024139 [Phalaenopsis equestris]